MYFAFEVLGWLNEQVVKADSEYFAWGEACSMAAGEENVRNFRKVDEHEAAAIQAEWK